MCLSGKICIHQKKRDCAVTCGIDVITGLLVTNGKSTTGSEGASSIQYYIF